MAIISVEEAIELGAPADLPYVSWEEAKALHKLGIEIGHLAISPRHNSHIGYRDIHVVDNDSGDRSFKEESWNRAIEWKYIMFVGSVERAVLRVPTC